jgi:hypothetical protein
VSAADARLRTVSTRLVRALVFLAGAAGIAGMIAGSIADNNGVAVTFGLLVAAAALVLVVATAINPARPLGTFDPAVATAVEEQVQSLVDAGADETAVRHLVRDAVTLGRTAG